MTSEEMQKKIKELEECIQNIMTIQYGHALHLGTEDYFELLVDGVILFQKKEKEYKEKGRIQAFKLYQDILIF